VHSWKTLPDHILALSEVLWAGVCARIQPDVPTCSRELLVSCKRAALSCNTEFIFESNCNTDC